MIFVAPASCLLPPASYSIPGLAESVSNKDRAGKKQLAWEQERDTAMKGGRGAAPPGGWRNKKGARKGAGSGGSRSAGAGGGKAKLKFKEKASPHKKRKK